MWKRASTILGTVAIMLSLLAALISLGLDPAKCFYGVMFLPVVIIYVKERFFSGKGQNILTNRKIRRIWGAVFACGIGFLTYKYLSWFPEELADINLIRGASDNMYTTVVIATALAYLMFSDAIPKLRPQQTNNRQENTPKSWKQDEEDKYNFKPQEPKQEQPRKATNSTSTRQSKGITLDSIAGYDKTKKSMMFLVDCFKDKKRLDKIGARMPAGILLYGPPGTGKSLMAKAIAGSAGVPFFYISASEFVEKYVGVGASRIRGLFDEARSQQPAIIFIDEIDAVGKTRQGDTNDERQQTVNQLLVEMSEIAGGRNDGIMVIAATNNPDSLDSALTRPGRFDRKIAVPLPSKSDRLQIVKFHCRRKKIDKSVSYEHLADITEGMSGAMIETLLNEAAILSAFKRHNAVLNEDIEEALFQMLTGGEQMEAELSEKDLATVAHHEAGHALAIKLLTDESVPQVNVYGSTAGSLGVTITHAKVDANLLSKKQLEAKIMTLYAGRAAEECFFGNPVDITNGASEDIKRASELINEYLKLYGVSDDSPLNVSAFNGQSDNGAEGNTEEAKALAARLYAETKALLLEHAGSLEWIASALIDHKVVYETELDAMIV